MKTLTFSGRQVEVELPSLGLREVILEGLVAHGHLPSWRWIAGAVLGLCCPSLAARARAQRAHALRDLLHFGELVYTALRESGASEKDIDTAAGPLFSLVRESLAPRKAEVDAQVDFTDPERGAST